MKVLCIDDNQDIGKMLKTVLEGEGHEFEYINNGKSGLEKIRGSKYDLVLLDIAMPGFSGQQVVEQLDKENILKQNKIVLFTASAIPENDIQNMLKMGVHSSLRKPADIDEILKLLGD